MTFTYTTPETFTVVHARKLAAKIVADMHQCRRFYGEPTEAEITAWNDELVVMLAGGYVDSYEFGFKSKDRRVVSWFYTVSAAGELEGGRSGGLYPGASISGASMFNFMTTSASWGRLSERQRNAERAKHGVNRTTGEPPADGSGHWVIDRVYVAGGVAVRRREFQPW